MSLQKYTMKVCANHQVLSIDNDMLYDASGLQNKAKQTDNRKQVSLSIPFFSPSGEFRNLFLREKYWYGIFLENKLSHFSKNQWIPSKSNLGKWIHRMISFQSIKTLKTNKKNKSLKCCSVTIFYLIRIMYCMDELLVFAWSFPVVRQISVLLRLRINHKYYENQWVKWKVSKENYVLFKRVSQWR